MCGHMARQLLPNAGEGCTAQLSNLVQERTACCFQLLTDAACKLVSRALDCSLREL